MEDTLKRRFFYDQAFAIYGGKGLTTKRTVVLLVALILYLNREHGLPVGICLYQATKQGIDVLLLFAWSHHLV